MDIRNCAASPWMGNDHIGMIQEPVIIDVRIVLGFLKWIAAQVEQQGHTQFGNAVHAIHQRLRRGFQKTTFQSS